MKPPINPETKIGVLLDAYPGIEEVLIAWAPAFAKLRNPLLRKTVAKIATIEQAAKIGGVSVREMVRKLREATGQSDSETTPAPETAPDGSGAPAAAPAWLSEEQVRYRVDADSLLETGEHPIGKIHRLASSLQEREIIKLTSSFRPEPLIEEMSRIGLAVYSREISPGRHATYFCRVSHR